MLVKRFGLWVGVMLALTGCASGDSTTGATVPADGGAAGVGGSTSGTGGAGGSHAGTSTAGTSAAGTSAGGTSAGGTAGAPEGGAAGSAASTAGGTGGAAGTTAQGDAQLCVLNVNPPQGTCDATETLSFDLISAGTSPMRLIRVDNKSTAQAKFTDVATADPLLSIKTVRYEVDPGDPNNLLRIEATLPVLRDPNTSIYFEVTFVGPSIPGDLPGDPIKVTYKIGGGDDELISVPVTGEMSSCPAGTEACDSDPNNGCETNINEDENHCGGCNTPCAPANGQGLCTNGICTVAECTAPFADCNGDVNDGCEANLLTALDTCGQCDISCVKSQTNPICSGGHCNVSTCATGYADCNLDVNGYDGCEVNVTNDTANCGQCNIDCNVAHTSGSTCVNSGCVTGTCDDGWGDCNNAVAGCETDLNNDVNNCGGCGSAFKCFFAHAGATCSNATCVPGACIGAFLDCNNDTQDGCEVNSDTSTSNCGACDNDCGDTIVHANTSCTTGTCGFVSCKTGFIDLNNNPADGCEYQCTATGATDNPDDSFVDANCDGIDGVISEGIFVATGGSDSNPGTKAQPVLTINAGIAKANAAGKNKLFVSDGTYDGRVTLADGISIYGGYSASNNWARSGVYITKITSNATDGGRVTALDGANIITPTIIDRVTVVTGAASGTGISNYGLYCNNCTKLTVKNSNVTAGAGSLGVGGSNGNGGASGNNGSVGGGSSCDGSTPGGGGAGGPSACGRSGGVGGVGGGEGNHQGATGGSGVGGTPGGGGGNGGDPGQMGGTGATGASGPNGGNGGGAAGGSIATGFWVPANGGNGANGTPGNGGGGGGGGGGQGCTFCNDGPGNGGGGGGAGGCEGTAATGGTGGGGSFGLFLYNSTGIILINNTITSGSGGSGGSGGTGGTGGNPGGGVGGGTVCTGEVGGGGAGGPGGKGGNGGNGGGGAGGPSYAVFRVTTTVTTTGNTLNAGSPGSGGSSPSNSGATGASGPVN